ncbi:hypothetical protein QW131_15985 [Roseibium salinum]|nr:hypothetical protein [Roseibium salinum]
MSSRTGSATPAFAPRRSLFQGRFATGTPFSEMNGDDTFFQPRSGQLVYAQPAVAMGEFDMHRALGQSLYPADALPDDRGKLADGHVLLALAVQQLKRSLVPLGNTRAAVDAGDPGVLELRYVVAVTDRPCLGVKKTSGASAGSAFRDSRS